MATAVILGIMLALLLSGATDRVAQAVPIQVTYTDSPGEGFFDPNLGAARRNAFEAAASQWSQLLPGNIPVVIDASMDPLDGDSQSAVLGSAGPRDFEVDAAGLPLPHVYYPVALANELTGEDLNQGSPEIDAQFNSRLDSGQLLGGEKFYYGLDGNPPGDDIDFYSVILHELCHGLGFIDSTNEDGSYGFNNQPDVFDTFVATGPALNATRVPTLSQSDRAVAFASNSLYFAGPNTNAVGGGVNARLYAPNPYEPGSSVGHLDENTYHGVNELMTPVMTEVSHVPGPVTLAIMHDLGWGNNNTTPTPTPTPIVSGPTPTPLPVNRPANDNFVNAQAISGNSGKVTGTNVNATKETGEPSHSPDNNAGGASVWYRWTAPANGKVTFTTAGSNFDTVLAVYTGSSVGALTRVGTANDDVSSTVHTSSVTISVAGGTVYRIAVDGYKEPIVDMGSVVLNWTFTATAPTSPLNNNFAAAQVLSGNSGSVRGTNGNATKETGEINHAGNLGGKSVWYRWTAPANGKVTFSTVGSNFNTLLGVYTGTAVNALKFVASNNDVSSTNKASSVTFNVVAGTIYRIAVDGFNSTTTMANAASGNIILNWIFTVAAPTAPANNNFANAQVLSGKAGKVTGTSVNATKETGEPTNPLNAGGKSVWYRWTAPANGTATFNTLGSNFDTIMAVYTGSSLNALALIDKNDDAAGQTSSVTIKVVAGKIYQIAVDGFNATIVPTNAASGSIVLNWSFTPSATLTASNNSAVRLSTAGAEAATGLIHLRFSGAIDATIAADPGSYSVTVNGVAVPVESAAYASNNQTVSLALPESALRLGDAVVVHWNLRDAQDGVLVGQVGPVAAR